jgi:hypothetical protein
MTKKTSYRKKVSVRLQPGEAVFVADTQTLNHIVETYTLLGDEEQNSDYKEYWYSIANSISEWVQNTVNNSDGEDFDDQEEW